MKIYYNFKSILVIFSLIGMANIQTVYAEDSASSSEGDSTAIESNAEAPEGTPSAPTPTSVSAPITPTARTPSPAPVLTEAPVIRPESRPSSPSNGTPANSENDVVIHKIENGKISARARCNYAGEYGALAGSIELVLVDSRVTYLDVRADNNRCRVSLETFRQVNVGGNNIVLRNNQGCSVAISAQRPSRRNDGVGTSSVTTSIDGAVLTFGLVQVEGGGCSSLCYSVAGGTGFWQVEMDPRTKTCY